MIENLEYSYLISDEALQSGLEEHNDCVKVEELEVLANRLCQMYVRLKKDQKKQPEVYLPGGEWNRHIENRNYIYDAWLNGDIDKTIEIFRNFWRNDLGVMVKQYTTYQKLLEDADIRSQFIDQMSYDYMVWENLFDINPEELAVPPVGNPWGYYINNVMIAPKALRYNVLANQVTEITRDIKDPVIAEIGAGYGGFAYYLLRDKKKVTYVNFDLPEVLMIASYYLKRTLPHRKIFLYNSVLDFDSNILEEYDVILMPNWMLPLLPANSVDLFLNTFSLSEMSFATITEYMKQIERCCRGYLLHNNMDRKGVINLGYERTPCSKYPIDKSKFKQIYKRYDLFQRLHFGRDGDYRELLYKRISL